jgi:glycosyltransferase involved in cell wall biosynthesis
MASSPMALRSADRTVTLNVIVPARNERLNVPFFYERARRTLESIPGLDWNIVFVNNASEDGTLEQVLELRAADPRVKIITLSRDFGYHAALVAGLSSVDGDYYAIVDVDCEDPPELLADFYQSIQDGVQIAYGVRSNRDEPSLITFGRKLFYIANRRVADSEIVMWMGEFSMFTRQVRDAVLAAKTTFVSVRAELGHVGFARKGFSYQRAKRKYGETHYNLWRMTVYAVASILSGTTFPLRLVLYLAAAVGVGFPLYVKLMRLTAVDIAVAAAVLSLYFLVVSLPLIGLYLARTYKNVVARPIFVIDQTRTCL